MLAIDHGKPKLLSLKDAITCYIEHRREVVLRRTRFLLRQAEVRAETLEGYLIALANLDDFIRIIRDSANRDEAQDEAARASSSRAGRSSRSASSSAAKRASPTAATPSAKSRPATSSTCASTNSPASSATRSSNEYDELIETIKDLLDILAKE